MEINKCEDLKNFFVSDSFLFRHRKVIAVAVALLVFMLIRKLDKKNRTALQIIIAIIAGYMYNVFIGKLLNSVQDASLNEEEKYMKEAIVDNMVENCKVVLEQPFM